VSVSKKGDDCGFSRRAATASHDADMVEDLFTACDEQ
jgi:hypothetical protein